MHERKTMKTRHMGSRLRLVAGVVLMWASGQAFAMYETTDAERAVLPIYCKDTQGFAGYGDKWGIMEQPPPAADAQPGENSLVFNEQEHCSWRRATWLRP
jgi:hypothetical protein